MIMIHFPNLVKILLGNTRMIELVVLFLIVIIIVLCILSMMYKCTNGTMATSDFSVDACFDFGFGTNQNSNANASNKTTPEVTKSPLLSGGGSSDMLFGTGGSGDDDDVDYSPYVDYYNISNDDVKVKTYEDRNNDGEPDFVDSVDVEVYGPGECAKICYEQEEMIDDRSCNAFKMNSDGRTCTLYWSQSKTGNTTNENVYRLKQPNVPDSHETDLENTLIFANSNVHVFSAVNYEHKHEQYDWDGEYNLEDEYNSIIVPGDRCVYLYSDVDLTGEESEPIYTSRRRIVPGFRSIRIGSPSEDGGFCNYDVSDENYVKLPSRTGCVNRESGGNVENLCAEQTTSDDCETYTWGPANENVCTWLE